MLKLNTLSGFGSGVSGAAGGNGYICGGETAGPVGTSDKMSFSTDIMAAATDADLTTIDRAGLRGISDPVGAAGYFGGGNTGGAPYTEGRAEKLTYANDTMAAASDADMVVSGTLEYAASSEGSTHGYWVAGYDGSGSNNGIDKLTFATDTTASVTDVIASARYLAGGGVSDGSTKGYIMGGHTGAYGVDSHKITFATNAIAATTDANLSSGRSHPTGGSDVTGGFGWYMGGGSMDTVDKLTFSTDTAAVNTDATMNNTHGGASGTGDGTLAAYVHGGYGDGDNDATEKLTFVTETAAAATDAVLVTPKSNQGSVSSNSVSGH